MMSARATIETDPGALRRIGLLEVAGSWNVGFIRRPCRILETEFRVQGKRRGVPFPDVQTDRFKRRFPRGREQPTHEDLTEPCATTRRMHDQPRQMAATTRLGQELTERHQIWSIKEPKCGSGRKIDRSEQCIDINRKRDSWPGPLLAVAGRGNPGHGGAQIEGRRGAKNELVSDHSFSIDWRRKRPLPGARGLNPSEELGPLA